MLPMITGDESCQADGNNGFTGVVAEILYQTFRFFSLLASSS
ncbi:hypothetical protein [Nostoc sp. TCL26-01]|nr:hypothetical protein [Nostoc sp. TCL26-01]